MLILMHPDFTAADAGIGKTESCGCRRLSYCKGPSVGRRGIETVLQKQSVASISKG